MKLRQTIYNSIGLAVAGLCALSFLGNILRLVRMNLLARRHPGEIAWPLVLALVIVIFVGGGGLVNLIKGRLQRGATIAMIVIYCLTIIGLPLGIWGIIELQAGGGPRRRNRAIGDSGQNGSTMFSTVFLRRAATLSWVCATGGSVLVVLCDSTHIRPLILAVNLIYIFVLPLSLIMGIVALCGVRQHGKRGILIPSIFGVSVSGLIILFFMSALVAGFLEAKGELQNNQRAVQGGGSDQTNAVPLSQAY